jgi:hypothetical protein
LKKLGEMLVYMLYIANNHVRYILNRLFFLENNTSIYCTVILPRATINYSVEALVHVPNKLKHQPAESLVSIIGSRFFFTWSKIQASNIRGGASATAWIDGAPISPNRPVIEAMHVDTVQCKTGFVVCGQKTQWTHAVNTPPNCSSAGPGGSSI